MAWKPQPEPFVCPVLRAGSHVSEGMRNEQINFSADPIGEGRGTFELCCSTCLTGGGFTCCGRPGPSLQRDRRRTCGQRWLVRNGAGFLVSGLALVVTQYPENVLPPLALGGLVGLGVGMGVGALEWASRDCASGFSFRPSFSGQAYGQSENHSTESFRWRTFRLAPAVEFTYRY